MNYYRRYMADYLAKTASLSIMEHGAYTLLLDYSYIHDGALPGEVDAVCRMVRAISPSERQAVQSVLAKFFYLADGRYVNERVLKEIAKAKPAIDAARTNGVKGGRPKNNPPGYDAETQQGGQSEPKAKASQPPTSNLQPLTTNPQPPEGKSNVGLTPDADPPGKLNGKGQPRHQALEVLAFLNEKTGRNYRPVPANIDRIAARLKQGATVDDCRAVIAKKCREWSADEKMNQYLRPATLFNAEKFAQYQGELGAENA